MSKLGNEKRIDDYSSDTTPTPPISMYDLVNGGNTNGSGVSYDATNTNSILHPDSSTPHKFSEWYGYDHDASGTLYHSAFVFRSPSFTSLSQACADTSTDIEACSIINWNGTIGNNTVVRLGCGTGAYNGGNYWYKMINSSGHQFECTNGTNTGSTYDDYVMQVSSSGVISNFQQCTSLTSYSSSVSSTFNQVCPFDGSNISANQTYYHDGSGSLPTTGDTCYSDSAGNTALGFGYYYLSGTGTGNRQYIQLNSSGVVQIGGVQTC